MWPKTAPNNNGRVVRRVLRDGMAAALAPDNPAASEKDPMGIHGVIAKPFLRYRLQAGHQLQRIEKKPGVCSTGTQW
jgi:hypothetical protein